MRLNSATLSLLPSLQVNSHAAEAKGRDAEKESGNKRVVEGGRGCEKVIEKQQLREIKCLCEHAGACLGERDGAQRSRTANYDSSGMSPELSAQMEIKRAVSGPIASQSDSHVNNIGWICCNLGIIYPTPPRREEKKLTICPLKVKMSIWGDRVERACVSYSKGTVSRAWAGPLTSCTAAWPEFWKSLRHHLSVMTLAYIHFTFMTFKRKTDAKGL